MLDLLYSPDTKSGLLTIFISGYNFCFKRRKTNLISMFFKSAPVSLESLVSILSCVLTDESPVAIRQACLALQVRSDSIVID